MHSPTLHAHARLDPHAELQLGTEHEERALYVVEGAIGCDGRRFEQGALIISRAGVDAVVSALVSARVMLLGGAKLAGERHVFWNFVSSSPGRIERAKDDWRSGRFPKVVGDEIEFIPLL